MKAAGWKYYARKPNCYREGIENVPIKTIFFQSLNLCLGKLREDKMIDLRGIAVILLEDETIWIFQFCYGTLHEISVGVGNFEMMGTFLHSTRRKSLLWEPYET
jgi:hypothetical protein